MKVRRQQIWASAFLLFAGSIASAYFLLLPAESDLPSAKGEYAELRNTLQESVEKEGGKKAYAAFLSAVEKIPIDPHTQAHIFGEALYAVDGLEGISVCDTSLRFGCFHSFFGQAIYEKGIDILPELDAMCRMNFGEDTKCQHGLGHGILVYVGYEDLQKALELCESISDHQTGGCFGGVFMEYNFHTMEQVEDGIYIREIEEGGQFKPCDELPKRFAPACYLEQVQWWGMIYDSDFTYIGALCNTLRFDIQAFNSCFRGIGNNITETVNFDQDKVIEWCKEMPDAVSSELCYEGSTWLIVGREEYKQMYEKLCSLLTGGAKLMCHERGRTVKAF